MYTETVMDHFARPRNVGIIENPDGYARVESDVHNDLVDIYITVADGRLADVRFKAFGCAAAIASTSMATELARGLTLEEAAAITEEDVVRALGGLPEDKVRCSLLAPEALRRALDDYARRRGAGDAAPAAT